MTELFALRVPVLKGQKQSSLTIDYTETVTEKQRTLISQSHLEFIKRKQRKSLLQRWLSRLDTGS